MEGLLDQKQKKTTRDLSDLRARLSLATPSPGAAAAAAAPAAVAPGVMPHYFNSPSPGVVQPQVLVDAGPPIEIPLGGKSSGKLALALVVIAAIPLGVGWACGRIYSARSLFNETIEDAETIHAEVLKMARVNKQVAVTMARARTRIRGRLTYDAELLKKLNSIVRSAPGAVQAKAARRQERLFQTNYALMEGIVIERLFKYYNNTLRLMDALQRFIQHAEGSREQIERHDSTGGRPRKYGVVPARDVGSHYLGRLVEVGNIDCADETALNACRRGDIRGFYTRSGAAGSWSPRAGKPRANGTITEVVIPIVPDESWRQVAISRRGYFAHRSYVDHFGRVAAIAALLSKEEKKLVQDLSKAANRELLYAPL